MREVLPERLWLSNAVEVGDVRRVLSFGVEALVDLAADEPILVHLPRDLVYLRFPLVDGDGNNSSVIQAAVDVASHFVKTEIPTVVFCSAGLSRSPCIVAAAIAKARGIDPHTSLEQVVKDPPSDISPLLWQSIVNACF